MSSEPISKTTPEIPSKWSWHFRTLQALRQRLAGEWTEHKQDSVVPEYRDHKGFAGTASELTEHEILAAKLALEKNMLIEVDAALRRLQQGTYGICERTGMPIPLERLRALPWTRFTREAAEQMELEGKKP